MLEMDFTHMLSNLASSRRGGAGAAVVQSDALRVCNTSQTYLSLSQVQGSV